MNLRLIKLTKEYETRLKEMIEEWKSDIIENNTNHSPWVNLRMVLMILIII